MYQTLTLGTVILPLTTVLLGSDLTARPEGPAIKYENSS